MRQKGSLGKPPVISDLDIYRSANVLVKRHGPAGDLLGKGIRRILSTLLRLAVSAT